MAKPTEVAVARLLKPHGLRGEIAAKLITDNPDRVAAGGAFSVSPPVKGLTRVVIQSIRSKKDVLLLTLEGVEDRPAAETFCGTTLTMPLSELPELEEGTYYYHDLIGLLVSTTDGRALGTLDEILETGANDVYVIHEGDSEVLVPAIGSVVKHVDLESGTMTIEPMRGLLPEESDAD